jgi:hypothetical protein
MGSTRFACASPRIARAAYKAPAPVLQKKRGLKAALFSQS